ncbi:MAG: hypothetical protein R2911_11615 [Caldilineaceae bacterium]
MYDREAIDWLLANVHGNAVIVESSEADYYRAGSSRAASMTGLSSLRGFHEGEQRYGDVVGQRQGQQTEFWNTPDRARTLELIRELHVGLIYVGQIEEYLHPEGVKKIKSMAADGELSLLYENDRVTIYGVPGELAQVAP